MGVTRTGSFFENTAAGVFGYGFAAAGGLTVVDGARLILPGGTEGAVLQIGRAPGGVGTVLVTGPGSRLEMTGAGQTASPLGLDIGGDGGRGRLELRDGAGLSMVEPAATDVYLDTGRGPGSDGTLRAVGATMAVSTAGFLSVDIGRDGGRGRMELDAGAELTGSGLRGHLLRVGREGGEGTLALAGEARMVAGSGQGAATLAVAEAGAGTTGRVELRGGAGLSLEGRTDAVAGIARGDGNSGSVVVEDGWLSLTAASGQATLEVGRAGGEGRLEVGPAGRLTLAAATDGWLLVGGDGGHGRMGVDAGEVLLMAGRNGGLRVGARFGEPGGDGAVTLQNGAAVVVETGAAGNLRIGSGADSHGTVEIRSGSRIDLGGRGSLELSGGGAGGVAALTVDGAGSQLLGARIAGVGIDGGRGAAVLSDGGRMVLGGAGVSEPTALDIGRGLGADGRVEIRDGLLVQQGAHMRRPEGGGWEPYALIGGDGGTGRLEIAGDAASDGGYLQNGGYLQIGGVFGAFSTIDVGRGSGGTGTVAMTGGLLRTENAGFARDVETGAAPELAGAGGSAGLRLGLAAGTGVLEATAGARVEALATREAALSMGTGGQGRAALDASHLLLRGADARLLIGAEPGGDGRLALSGGATARIEATGGAALVLIGREGGTGHLVLAGEGTVMSLAGPEARMVVADAANVARGRLDVLDGARLEIGEALFVGGVGAGAGAARVWLGGGTIAAGKIGLQEASFLAAGRLEFGGGPGGLGLTDTLLRLGDGLDAAGEVAPGIGTLKVEGAMSMTGGRALFAVEGAEGVGWQADRLEVAGRLVMGGTDISLAPLHAPAPEAAPEALPDILLATAAEGITLVGVRLDAGSAEAAPELRGQGTELWLRGAGGADAGPAPPPVTGPVTGPVTVTVADPAGAPLAGAVVTFAPDGAPPRSVPGAAEGGLLPADTAGRLGAVLEPGAVTTGSALEALRLAVGLPPSWGVALPQHFIAADIDRDGVVTTADALAILRLAVGLSSEVAARHVFLDATADLSAIGRSSVDYAEGIAIEAAQPGAAFALTGILLGQVQEIV